MKSRSLTGSGFFVCRCLPYQVAALVIRESVKILP